MKSEKSDWGGLISVRAASEQLRVSPDHVRDLVRAGDLDAVTPGREVLVTSESVARRAASAPAAGRPLTPANAWAVLWLASGQTPNWVSSSDLVRVRRFAARPLPRWPRMLINRAHVHRVRVPDPVLNRVRSLTGVTAGGAAAAASHGSNLLPGVSEHEFYLTQAALHAVRGVRGVGWRSPSPNVVLRVLPGTLPPDVIAGVMHDVAVRGMAAADLLDRGDERSRHAAAELLGRER
ncbi:helix-turn-helix domain-containing protein [Umezawaea sp. Da 62-37]|uniref:helix-turn-helix domain-containing protein n=1 Tax=Umezawaea sp. Da 62-37 TaxID=3075927 RepID=UPI0028F72501|nr:helix-turn-helix domain-containing protein [Umezawaea sp. Da 62-37]WNV87640.1 helix-turn-helix domain-containing protein [Umezawaea sp. Da 62-37]